MDIVNCNIMLSNITGDKGNLSLPLAGVGLNLIAVLVNNADIKEIGKLGTLVAAYFINSFQSLFLLAGSSLANL